LKKKHVVGIRDSLIAADVAHVNAAIWEYEVRRRSAFFRAAMATGAAAMDIADCDRVGVEQAVDCKVRHVGRTRLVAELAYLKWDLGAVEGKTKIKKRENESESFSRLTKHVADALPRHGSGRHKVVGFLVP
jgi:hypothetical protein